jgi:hypothetical protein
MAVNLSPYGGVGAQFLDNSGNVLTGGKIYTYAAGTTTPQATYTSSNGVTPHSNPIILDASGRVPSGEIWITDGLSYKFVLETSTGVLIGTYDNVSNITDASQLSFTGFKGQVGVVEDLADNDGSDWIGFEQAGTGAVAISAQDKMRQIVNVKDFGAIGDGVADDTIAIQAAVNYFGLSEASNAQGTVTFPTGRYRVTSTINIPSREICIDGQMAAIVAEVGSSGAVFKSTVTPSAGKFKVIVQNFLLFNFDTGDFIFLYGKISIHGEAHLVFDLRKSNFVCF